MWALSSLSLHGCQRSWEGLRLVTEQGKQLALNSERIASLYSVEGYRLAPNRYSRGSGANFLFFTSFHIMHLKSLSGIYSEAYIDKSIY